jgi:hypothetical protein
MTRVVIGESDTALVIAQPKNVLIVGAGIQGAAIARGNTGATGATGLVQIIDSRTATMSTGTTLIPVDNTIPQNTEGDQYLSATITPSSASSILEIDVIVRGSHSAGATLTVALFQDSTANALNVGTDQKTITNFGTIVIKHWMTSGTTSATTFKVRAGGPNAGTFTLNGSAGAGYFNGTYYSSITIKEWNP